MVQDTMQARPAVHRATVADAETLLAVRERLLNAGIDVEAIPGEPAALATLLCDPAVVITCALADAAPIGLAYLLREPDGRVRIKMLCVLPEERRRGAGAALLTTALFAALPASAIYAFLPATDRAAVAWARTRGFRQISRASAPGDGHLVEFELRLDAPADACGSGGCGCGGGGCGCAH